jgi:hypothetical protein
MISGMNRSVREKALFPLKFGRVSSQQFCDDSQILTKKSDIPTSILIFVATNNIPVASIKQARWAV